MLIDSVRGIKEFKSKDVYPIRPDQVPLNGESAGASTFGIREVEKNAGHLLSFFKSKGLWCEFTIEELRHYYKIHAWAPNTMFYGLIGMYEHLSENGLQCYAPDHPYVIIDPDGICCITEDFIRQCMRAQCMLGQSAWI